LPDASAVVVAVADPESWTVAPEPSEAGEIVPEMLGNDAAAVIVTTKLNVVEPWLTVNVTDEFEDTDPICAEKVALVVPDPTVMDVGTVTCAPDGVEYPTAAIKPLGGAAPVNVTVQTVEPGV